MFEGGWLGSALWRPRRSTVDCLLRIQVHSMYHTPYLDKQSNNVLVHNKVTKYVTRDSHKCAVYQYDGQSTHLFPIYRWLADWPASKGVEPTGRWQRSPHEPTHAGDPRVGRRSLVGPQELVIHWLCVRTAVGTSLCAYATLCALMRRAPSLAAANIALTATATATATAIPLPISMAVSVAVSSSFVILGLLQAYKTSLSGHAILDVEQQVSRYPPHTLNFHLDLVLDG
ncbi:hypothetical protein F4802DRAFT_543258 [Xylaria palmicola]|nr:hypothetical protein F4802DRAFT_543258 [Xylaria palmicola]